MTVGTGKLLRGTVATFIDCITCGSQETGVEAWGGPSAFIAFIALLLTCSSLWFDRGHREALTNSLEDTFMNRNRQQAEPLVNPPDDRCNDLHLEHGWSCGFGMFCTC